MKRGGNSLVKVMNGRVSKIPPRIKLNLFTRVDTIFTNYVKTGGKYYIINFNNMVQATKHFRFA